ncbi:hypothetical protein [Oceaniglobus trochenteri]|uniref:hypothetical protein n=1 Tax=Oceaniglobus trochenteri TaxID=2763260 RepID=UPI001CFFDA9A|nr:hypothetical protein [Oceaniglobus trochenteri]
MSQSSSAATASTQDKPAPLWIGAREIAGLLDMSVGAFNRNAPRLIEDEGFPCPSPHRLRPVTWRRSAVLQWIATQGYARADTDAAPARPGSSAGAGATVHLLRLASGGA